MWSFKGTTNRCYSRSEKKWDCVTMLCIASHFLNILEIARASVDCGVAENSIKLKVNFLAIA